MLKAESEGVTPQQLVARIAAGRAAVPRGLPHQLRSLALDRLAREHASCRRTSTARCGDAGLIDTQADRAVLRPGQGHVPAPTATSRASARTATRKDQYGDACEVCSTVYAPTDLINPYSTLTGATAGAEVLRALLLPACPTRSCVAFLKEWLDTPGRAAAARCVNKAREWLDGSGEQALADWDISRDAPYFGIEIPDAPGKYFYVWLDAPIGYLAALQELLRQRQGARQRRATHLRGVPGRGRYRADPLHRQGHHLLPHAVLAGDAAIRGPPYKVPDHVYVHGFLTVSGEKMSKSRGTGICPLRYLELGMNPEWLRYYIAAKLNAQRRGPRLQPRRLRRARQQRPDRQVRQHRQPRGGFITQALRRPARATGGDDRAAAATRSRAAQRAPGRTQLYEDARVRQGAARDHGARRPRQPLLRRAQALGAGQGPGARRASCRTSARAR